MTAARPPLALLITAYVAFIGLGLPDAVTGVAWPSIREDFGQGQSGLGLILFASAAGYLLSSALAGTLLQRLSIGLLLSLSTAAVVTGLAGWVMAPSFVLLLACAPLLGLGGGAIDAALNLFVATRFGPRQLNWLHAFYGLGAALGPLLMTAALTAPGGGWRLGIGVIALLLASLALFYGVTRRAWDAGGVRLPALARDGEAAEPAAAARRVTLGGTLGQGRVWLQIAAFFLIAGLEATAGQWSFALQTEGRGLGTTAAGMLVGGFWAAFTAGRVAAGFVVERIGSVRLTRIGALLAAGGALLQALAPGAPVLAGAGLVLMGVSVAPLFPGLMAETPRRLGAATAAHAVGFQVSGAILGAAALPALAGLAIDHAGLEAAAWAMVVASLALVGINEALVRVLDRAG